MSGGGLDVEAFLDRLRGIATEWDAAHDQLETMQVVSSSRDQLATATADSGGTVVDLVLAPGLRRHGSDVVSASILEATSTAVELANSRRAELVSGSLELAVGGRKRAAQDVLRADTSAPPAGHGTS